jgi:hypothetical protein
MAHAQLSLFKKITCCYCGKDPGISKDNAVLWHGFLDMDTGQHVCFDCQVNHYVKKIEATPGPGTTYSEMPVVII